jgi:hypothetical protein
MMFKLLLSLLLSAAPGLAQAFELVPLKNNGATFIRGEDRMPLRCLELEGLLEMPDADAEQALDRAAAAGFNSVSFHAPVFGPGGFCTKLGTLQEERVLAFKELLNKFESKQLYAWPVVWTPGAVEAFSKIGGGPEKFFSGKAQNQWQAWLLRELVRHQGGALQLSSTAALGGWILYRGDWPGPKKRSTENPDDPGAQAFTAPLRRWLLWQLRALRSGGSRQMAGIDLLLKGDLRKENSDGDPAADSSMPGAPVADLREGETVLPDLAAMDKLPPLPGGEKIPGNAETEAMSPWDLEGLDWDSVGRALREIPAATGLDFMQLTLDTEDWYRLGETMGEVVEKEMQVPLVWRQDWRTASRYERQKRLQEPEGLAGLMGPWPDNDWPDEGESIWPPLAKGQSAAKALSFKYLELRNVTGKPVLAIHLNRKATLVIQWDRRWPPSKRGASLDPALIHKFPLKGAKFGEKILFYAKAKSKVSGNAVLRSRWLTLKAPPKAPSKARAGAKKP